MQWLFVVAAAVLRSSRRTPGSSSAWRQWSADTGRPSVIGALDVAAALLAGAAGTTVVPD